MRRNSKVTYIQGKQVVVQIKVTTIEKQYQLVVQIKGIIGRIQVLTTGFLVPNPICTRTKVLDSSES